MAAVDWKNVGADFGRGTATMMGNALDATKGFSNYFNNLGQQIGAEERQKVLDDRASTLFQQSQDDRARSEKDRQSRILMQELGGEVLNNLQSKDTQAMSPELGSVLSSVQGMPTSSGSTGGIGAAIQVPYVSTKKTAIPLPNEDIAYKVLAGSKTVENPYKEGPMTSARTAALKPLQEARETLLRGGANYTGIPGDDTRRMTPEAKARLTAIDMQVKEIMRDKSVPKTSIAGGQKIDKQTTFNDLDLSKAFTADRKPATTTTSLDKTFVIDKVSGNLVPLSKAMEAGSKIGQAPTEKIETVVGTKTIPGRSLAKIMKEASATGMNPEAVKQTYGAIDKGYKDVLNMLPKDNTTRRDELRGYLTQMSANLGLDPKDYDVTKEVDKLLPKAEMGESQKFAANTIIHALDKKRDEIMENKKLALQEKNMLLDQEYRNATLSLQRMKIDADSRNAKTQEDSFTKALKSAAGGALGKEELTMGGRLGTEKSIQELLKNSYEMSDKGGFLGMGTKSFDQYRKENEPALRKRLAEEQVAKLKGVQF